MSTKAAMTFDDLPTEDQWTQVMQSELVDKDGRKSTFKDLTQDRRTIVVFVRHWWCINCQAYVSQLSALMPPASLPQDISVIIIGCGDYSPIKTYVETTQVVYPIYGNPSLSIYKALRFHSTLNGSKAGEEKGYMKELGSWGTRFWSGLRQGPAKNILQHASIGPKAQNGGELVVEADGRCSFIHRMTNTADHMELEDLVRLIKGEDQDLPAQGGKA